MRITRVDGTWLPVGTVRVRRRLEVGDLLALNFRAWRVWDIRDIEPTEDEARRLAGYAPEYRAKYAPYKFAAKREHGPIDPNENTARDAVFRYSGLGYGSIDLYNGDRVPLCSCCSHPWPCQMLVAEDQSRDAARVMEERIARMGTGICYGCGEVITSRQQSIGYPDGEGNADLPGAPSPRFHARKSCSDERLAYERRRAKALPDAPAPEERSPLW